MATRKTNSKKFSYAKNPSRHPRVLAGVIVVLLVVVAWSAWQSMRTTTITGTATVPVRPDKFTFEPAYYIETNNEETARNIYEDKGQDTKRKLVALGVSGKDISFQRTWRGISDRHYPTPKYIVEYWFTINTYEKQLADKVSAYLKTTKPQQGYTAELHLSDGALEDLEDQARKLAIEHAHSQARRRLLNSNNVKAIIDDPYGIWDEDSCNEWDRKEQCIREPYFSRDQANSITYSVTVKY